MTLSFRKQVTLWLSRLLLALPFFLVTLFMAEAGLRLLGPRLFPHGQRCAAFDPAVHHRYLPGCVSTSSPSASATKYLFNAQGLRDRPPSAFPAPLGAIAMLGDSVTKGLWLDAGSTIPAALERHLGRPVLNGGVRFSSPTTQGLHFLRDIEPHYPVRAVVWLLNGSDPTDERFYHSRALAFDAYGPSRFLFRDGDPFLEQDGWLPWLHARSRVVALLVRFRTFGWLKESIAHVPSSPAVHCGGIERLASHLGKKGIPLLVALTPHYAIGLSGNWMGEESSPAELQAMAECARRAGATVIDLSGQKLERAWFLEDLIHYSPEGAEWVASRLAPEVGILLQPKSRR